MPSITLRNIPEALLESIRTLSERERRSLNNELIVVLEEGMASRADRSDEQGLGPELQAKLWLELCGAWEDDERSPEETLEEIRAARSMGREVAL